MSIRVYERPDPKIRYPSPPVNPILEYANVEIDDSLMVVHTHKGGWVAVEVLDDYMYQYDGWTPSKEQPNESEIIK